ncbi:uncharacterized protein C8Q71DRAFT_744151 [Rhodofomes roseus]|uniref:Phenol hydroxylase-like C-terminal dimerisation domain-containing protein n=1 Tax=Rhodofomes roseus TaxID=34475 RepID=A0ABQ8KP75_9APHY|nr:uncharacterized protein C8Q71DRAFT_744151 [Rhodofomes roseus]KAH9839765.1 hypothetical protein C8Q71DRAFT_744151 [Rhodofomes roseus]
MWGLQFLRPPSHYIPRNFGAALNAICVGRYLALKQALDDRDVFTQTRAPAFSFLTIPRGEGTLQSTEALGEQPLGSSAYNVTGDAYAKYSIDPAEGGLQVVVRPDGTVRSVAPLAATGYGELEAYFAERVLPASESANDGPRDLAGSQLTVGEISLEGYEEKREITKTALL